MVNLPIACSSQDRFNQLATMTSKGTFPYTVKLSTFTDLSRKTQTCATNRHVVPSSPSKALNALIRLSTSNIITSTATTFTSSVQNIAWNHPQKSLKIGKFSTQRSIVAHATKPAPPIDHQPCYCPPIPKSGYT